jgi:hypothetical protein
LRLVGDVVVLFRFDLPIVNDFQEGMSQKKARPRPRKEGKTAMCRCRQRSMLVGVRTSELHMVNM